MGILDKFYTFVFVGALPLTMFGSAEPAASWNFNSGKNLDLSTGMTEFSRTAEVKFSGLTSEGLRKITLIPGKTVDPTRFFADSLRGMALRTGVDRDNNTISSASGKLTVPLSRKQGSVAMWVKPENWNGNNKEAFRIFFAADDGVIPRSNEFLIYKVINTNNIIFLTGDNSASKWSQIHHSVWNWKAGEWHFICAAYNPEKIYLYVDGKLSETTRKSLPEKDYSMIHLGSRGWKKENGLTQLDDVAIFDHCLSKEEMDLYFQKTRPLAENRKSPIEQRLGIQTPVLDGQIQPGEYGWESNATFNVRALTIENFNRWAVARDRNKIYFACESREPLASPVHVRRDGNHWEDESVEFHLEYNNKRWQFVVNSNGAYYDSHQGKSKWNIKNLELKNRIGGGRWTVEGAVSFADLGITPVAGDRIFLTICRGNDRSGGMAASPLLRSFGDSANYIKFILDDKAFALKFDFIKVPGGNSQLALKATSYSAQPVIFKAEGAEKNGRLVFGKIEAVQISGKTGTAAVQGNNLAKEGIVKYEVTCNQEKIASAFLPYLSSENIKVAFIRTKLKEQLLETHLTCNPPLPPQLVISQFFKDKNGKEILRHEHVLKKDDTNRIAFDLQVPLREFPSGHYDYYVETKQLGEAPKVIHHQLFYKPGKQIPWQNFTGGIGKETPAPWHTPKAEGAKLSCLTQIYDFTDSLLPRQITVKGQELFTAPLCLRLNGRELNVPARFQITEQTPQSLKFKSMQTAQGMEFVLSGTLEYDGFCDLKLTYGPVDDVKSVQIHDLALVMKIRQDYSKLVCTFKPEAGKATGKLENFYLKDLINHPVFWVGDADYGIYWGADNMRGTHVRNTEDFLKITKENNNAGAVAVIKLVDEAFNVTGRRSIEFSLQGTPVKDPRKDIVLPLVQKGGVNIMNYISRFFNYHHPDYVDIRKGKERVVGNQKKFPNEYCAFYAAVYGVSPYCPEWPWFAEEWISSPPGVGQFKQDFPVKDEAARNEGVWAFGCVQNPDFLNWQLWHMSLLINNKELGLRDLYFDMGYPRSCNNPLHGCGWQDDFGKYRMNYPIRANREFAKRIRKLLHDKNPKSLLIYHTSTETLPPVCGQADMICEGELFVAQVAKEESYYNIFTPELFQAAFTGIQSGTVNAYISQLNRSAVMLNPARSEYWRRKVKTPEALKAIRHFIGYCMLHNLKPVAGAGIYNDALKLEAQLRAIGWANDQVQFHPYWRKDCPVKANGKILVSGYTLPERMVAVILNDTDQTVRTALTRPAGCNGRIYDLETNRDISISSIEITPRGLKFVVFDR